MMKLKLNEQYIGYLVTNSMREAELMRVTVLEETDTAYKIEDRWGESWFNKNQFVKNSPGLQVFRELRSVTFGDNPPSVTTTKYPDMYVIIEDNDPIVVEEPTKIHDKETFLKVEEIKAEEEKSE
jgi:hypothetical protein